MFICIFIGFFNLKKLIVLHILYRIPKMLYLFTGIVIKCHQSRSQDENRKIAREQLIAKLDEIQNGEDSVASQKKRKEETKYKKSEYKKKKMANLKSEWKKREGLA